MTTASILMLICTVVAVIFNLLTWLSMRKTVKLLREAREAVEAVQVRSIFASAADERTAHQITESLRNVGRWPG